MLNVRCSFGSSNALQPRRLLSANAKPSLHDARREATPAHAEVEELAASLSRFGQRAASAQTTTLPAPPDRHVAGQILAICFRRNRVPFVDSS